MNFLKPGNVPLLTIFRHKRRDCHKLKKPEDKSSIILGKFKESKAFPKPGVSEKAVSLRFWKGKAFEYFSKELVES